MTQLIFQGVAGGGGGGGGISRAPGPTWFISGVGDGRGVSLDSPRTHVRTQWEVLDQDGGLFHTGYSGTAREAIRQAREALDDLHSGWRMLERAGHRSERRYIRLTAVRQRTITTVTELTPIQRISDIEGES